MSELWVILAGWHWLDDILIMSVHLADDIWLALTPFGSRLRRRMPELAQRQFNIPGAGELVTGDEIQRYPGKRVLLHGWLNNERVVAKFYLGRVRGWREWSRGLKGSQAFIHAGVPAPAIRAGCYLPEAGAWLTVMQHVSPDQPWPPTGTPMPWDAHSGLIRTLAEHHERGIVQNDLNPANFLPLDGGFQSLDGDRVHFFGGPLDKRRSLKNLNRFYGYKTAFTNVDIRAGYTEYCDARGWALEQDDMQALLEAVHRNRRAVAARVAWRSVRGWKYFKCKRDALGRQVISDQRRLTDGVKVLLQSIEGPIPVQHVESGLRITPIDPWPLGRGLAGLIIGTRPMRAWFKAVFLGRLNVPVEAPVALIQERGGLFRQSGFLIQEAGRTRRLADAVERLSEGNREVTLTQIRRILTKLRQARLTHIDLSCKTLGWDTAKQQVILLNVNGIRRYSNWMPGYQGVWERDTQRLVADLAARCELDEEALTRKLLTARQEGNGPEWARPYTTISRRGGPAA